MVVPLHGLVLALVGEARTAVIHPLVGPNLPDQTRTGARDYQAGRLIHAHHHGLLDLLNPVDDVIRGRARRNLVIRGQEDPHPGLARDGMVEGVRIYPASLDHLRRPIRHPDVVLLVFDPAFDAVDESGDIVIGPTVEVSFPVDVDLLVRGDGCPEERAGPAPRVHREVPGPMVRELRWVHRLHNVVLAESRVNQPLPLPRPAAQPHMDLFLVEHGLHVLVRNPVDVPPIDRALSVQAEKIDVRIAFLRLVLQIDQPLLAPN